MNLFSEFEPEKKRPLPKKPKHGPYAELYLDEEKWKWRRRLNEEGKKAVSEYLEKYPDPASLIYRLSKKTSEWLMADHNARDEVNQRARVAVVEGFMQFNPDLYPGVKAETFISTYIKGEIFKYIKNEKMIGNGFIYPDKFDDSDEEETLAWAHMEDDREKEPLENVFHSEYIAKVLELLEGDDKAFIIDWFRIYGENRDYKYIAKKWGVSIEEAELRVKDIIENQIRPALGIEI